MADLLKDSALAVRFAAACAVAREGGALARRFFENRGSFQVSFKGPQNYLTEADQAVERLITGRLRELFPEDSLFGEEDGGSFGRHTWVIDPIDGTENFARGILHWCVV
ncbi:MAG: inositol monophosphatase, partial [Deltaproteobacteria bacterium]|nr:inositol monophosphatase [Deltaproteobacteria bacterium]